jgi:hypothetical protein
VGVREKKADSAADTKAITTNNTSIEITAMAVPIENGFMVTSRSGAESKKCMVLWTGNVIYFLV